MCLVGLAFVSVVFAVPVELACSMRLVRAWWGGMILPYTRQHTR